MNEVHRVRRGSVRGAARNVLHGGHAREAARKAMQRLRRPFARAEAARALAWAEAQVRPGEEAMPDVALREEAAAAAARLTALAEDVLPHTGVAFGGGGHIVLLHYLVRARRPLHVLETGVAAGWSSRAILEAMARNGEGHLWSSDLPYLRQAGAPDVIGCLVSDELRHRWTLLTDGDRANLPKLLDRSGPIDLVHYDSDKSRSGRTWAWAQIRPHLAPGAVVVIDDIHDDRFFADLVAETQLPHVVLREQGKYVGVLYT